MRDLLKKVQGLEGADEVALDFVNLAIFLVLAGLLGLYVRYLYNRCSRSLSDTDSTGSVFPLLTVVTAAVITVVKSSLALSLGLVGALSIVRFRVFDSVSPLSVFRFRVSDSDFTFFILRF